MPPTPRMSVTKRKRCAVEGEEHRAARELPLRLLDAVKAAGLEINLGLQDAVGPDERHEVGARGAAEPDRDRLQALAGTRAGRGRCRTPSTAIRCGRRHGCRFPRYSSGAGRWRSRARSERGTGTAVAPVRGPSRQGRWHSSADDRRPRNPFERSDRPCRDGGRGGVEDRRRVWSSGGRWWATPPTRSPRLARISSAPSPSMSATAS